MKIYILFVSIIIVLPVEAQINKKTIKPSSWDSLYLFHEQTKKQFDNIFSKEYQKSDTLRTKDSLVITLISKSGHNLQKIVVSINEKGCEYYVKHTYFNQSELPAYIERYRKTCPKRRVKNIYDKEFIISLYERFVYDKDNNLVLHVDNVSSSVTIKELYFIDELGNRQVKRQRIHETDFWK